MRPVEVCDYMYTTLPPSLRGDSHHIDLRSDTVTKPSTGMRRAMAKADVGDDVYGEDPTVRALEERVAAMAGKEAGLFVPSGTQSNLVAIMTHCNRGDEVILGDDYHAFVFETGGAAAIGGVVPNPVPTDQNGGLSPDDALKAIKPNHTWFAQAKLLALENTVSGQVQTLESMNALCELARQNKLLTHLDGARIWNAMLATNQPLDTLAASFDSISTCLSKGLGAPVGSVLCGSVDFIARAERIRKVLGGGMRQAGVLAACGLFALDNNLPLLLHDHDNARRLADGLSDIDDLVVHAGDTNMMFLEPLEADRQKLVQYLADNGIRVGGPEVRIRVVTHLDVSATDIEKTIDVVHAYYKLRPNQRGRGI